ncbi:hypothetical protein Zm00014a_029335 [Zea mays]|uniref:Uncharacterized protein n=1 Tax=Zea mays TaxID=4577 RepID=A0A3L6E7U6_MAIZE|nr:hypothetical protein Zm00014a_029335 [Zea mays]
MWEQSWENGYWWWSKVVISSPMIILLNLLCSSVLQIVYHDRNLKLVHFLISVVIGLVTLMGSLEMPKDDIWLLTAILSGLIEYCAKI